MRGIGTGQRIELLITPEVQQLIDDAAVKSSPRSAEIPAGAPAPIELRRRVVLWLHLNTMRSEALQFHLLSDQSLSNVWRKAAFGRLREARRAGGDAAWSKELENAIDIFRTKVALNVADEVPAAIGQPMEAGPAEPISTAGGALRNERNRVSVVMERDGGGAMVSTFITSAAQVKRSTGHTHTHTHTHTDREQHP